jgi:transposase
MGKVETVGAQIVTDLEQVILARWTPEVFRRFQCVWLTQMLNLPAQEIAKALDLNISTVRRIRTEFAREGIRAIDGKGNRGGRRNQCMSFEEEAVFLRNHGEMFHRSGVADMAALQAAFEAHIGRSVHKTTIYRLLERHGRKKLRAEAGRPEGEGAPSVLRRKGSPKHKRKINRVR